MKILVAGEWAWPWHERACADALTKLGHKVQRFSWMDRFRYVRNGDVEPRYISKYKEIQNRITYGPSVFALNADLLKAVKEFQPEVLFVYRATHIFPRTLRIIKQIFPATKLVQYCNDDPFSPKANKIYWRHLKCAIPLYDINFVYRYQNVDDFKKHGAKQVKLLRSYYIAERNYPVKLGIQDQRFMCDVVFAGHYEADFRVEYLEAIVKEGFKLNLFGFGGGWNNVRIALSSNSPLQELYPISPAIDEDYRKVLSGAKITLCFLSKINRDTYTRRNFEIPATGAFMLSEYSDDLATLFEEGIEAEFFRSKKEMLNKIRYYLSLDEKRREISRRGRERVMRDGHDVVARMIQMVKQCEKVL